MLYIGHYKTSDKNFLNNKFFLFDDEKEFSQWVKRPAGFYAYPKCAEVGTKSKFYFSDYTDTISENSELFSNDEISIYLGYKIQEKEWEQIELHARRRAKVPFNHLCPDGVARNGYKKWEDLIELDPKYLVNYEAQSEFSE